jgi:hypothetical protein
MQISDDLFLGPAIGPNPLFGSDGNPAPMSQGVGPMGRVYIWDTVPLTLQAAGLASSQNPGSGGSFTLTAGTGVTARTRADGTIEYVLDVPRCVTVTATGANTATYRITGYDVFGQPMTQLLAAPSTSTVATTKAFKTIISVTNANATAGTNGLTVGFNDKLGIPVRLLDVGYITSVKWAGVLAADAGTVVAADVTDPATASTTDVRGCYTPSSAANGSRRLVMTIAVPAIGSGPQATRVGAFGVTQA